MKIKKRTALLWYAIFFVLLSLLLLHIQVAHIAQVSALNFELLIKNFDYLKTFIALQVVAIIFLWKVRPMAHFFFALVPLFAIIESSRILLGNFNKINLFLLFFYVVAAFIFHQFVRNESSLACYRPNFDPNSLYGSVLKHFAVTVRQGDTVIAGALVNWDDASVFVQFVDTEVKRFSSDVSVQIPFEGKVIESKGKIVAETFAPRGLGILFDLEVDERGPSKVKGSNDWQNIYEIFSLRGISPQNLR